ncbi:MAG: class I SAM-dependent methyltransferase [Bacteroidia bacterium]|nr:class I SAM-dependent methyltransferase [Bacteroidia bacterium]
MKYDPIKRSLGKVFNNNPFLRKVFYKLLDMLLLRSWHIRREIKYWAKKQTDGISILDAGSGFGQYSYYLSAFNPGWEILGIDVKTEQIDDCNRFFTKIGKRDKVSFQYADLICFIQPEAYNLILSVDVMEHITEDEKVFGNLYKSLKKGGMMLISTPSDQGGSDVHEDHGESFIDEHVRDGYNIDDIRKKLFNAGFSEVEARYSYGTAGKISWKLSMKYPITILNVSKLFFIILPFYYLVTYPFCLLFNYLDLRGTHRTGSGLIVKATK